MEINEIASKQIYEMKPLEMLPAKQLGIGQGYSILRVPGGWLFIFIDSTCFVPLDNEFKMMPKRKKSYMETAAEVELGRAKQPHRQKRKKQR
jgi:hypothetical protein